LAILTSGPAAAEPSPADIVKKIYEQATVFCNGEDAAPPYTDKFLREVFDKPLADRYLTRLHNNQIDFDIFVDGQDCKLADLAIEPQQATADTAIVRARFRNLDKPRAVDFDFHRSSATWMIGDMRYKHRPFSCART
jgi:hypothetical protein